MIVNDLIIGRLEYEAPVRLMNISENRSANNTNSIKTIYFEN
jgi:hypothetical protein